MKLPLTIPVFGDPTWRGECPTEAREQVTLFARIRRQYPNTYGRIAVHIRNEGKRHFRQVARQKAEGMTEGAADVNVPGNPSFICELKRRDHTQSRMQPGQVGYLETAQEMGAFVCVALGADAAWEAFEEWVKQNHQP